MKQTNRFLMLFSLIFLLAACGGDSEPVAQPAAEEQEPVVQQDVATSPPPPTPLPPPVVSGSSEGVAEEPATQSVEETAPSAIQHPWPTTDFGYGVQIHGNATVGDPDTTMTVVREQLKLDWVKMQVQWWTVHPEPDVEQWFIYDTVIKEAQEHDLNVMVSVVGAPAWTRASGGENGPPDDYALYAAFLTELLQRFPGQIGAVEVWNEQNLDREWTTGNGISPEDYVRFLQTARDAIKAVDPNVIVISGALAPTGDGDWIRWANDFDYLDRALAAGMLDYADCVGAHHNGYNVPPNVLVEDTNTLPEAQTAVFRGPFDNQIAPDGRPIHSWTFKSTIDGYVERIRAYDADKKLCVTEFGWATTEGYDQVPEGFEFALDNTLQEQADYIVQAYQLMHDSGDVWLSFLFNFDFGNKGGGPTDDPVPYSIVDTNGIPRAAFGAIGGMEKPR